MVQLVRGALSAPPSGLVPSTFQLGGNPAAVDPGHTAEPTTPSRHGSTWGPVALGQYR